MTQSAVPTRYSLSVLRDDAGSVSRSEVRDHAAAGLRQTRKALSSKYLYDDAGSALFARITELPEYYLTAAEDAILTRHARDFVRHVRADDARLSPHEDARLNVVELGAGDGRKTKVLLRALLDADVQFDYVPIDISSAAMDDLYRALAADFEGTSLSVHGIVADYAQALAHISNTWPWRRTVVLFLGSSIGNFTRDSATDFLTEIHANLKPYDMLFAGFDLKKDPDVLLDAYADPAGVTRDFNLNLLTRLNREAGANFDLDAFQHHAFYNPVRGAMESYLVARQEVDVTVNGDLIHFDKGEPIHMEFSHKYLPKEALAMMHKAGFTHVTTFFDDKKWFMDALMQITPVSQRRGTDLVGLSGPTL